jgi:hypothetical protein
MDPATGKPLYTVCKHRGKVVFWNTEHPTMGAWEYIINLYATKPGFLLLAVARTLLEWLQNDAAVQEACLFAYASAGTSDKTMFSMYVEYPQWCPVCDPTLKLDEEKSKHGSFAQQNCFHPACLHSLLRLVKGAAKQCTHHRRVY